MTTTTAAAPSSLARLLGVGCTFGDRVALADVDLEVCSGALTVVAGPNGAGKSTLLEVVAGVREPSSGTRSTTSTIAFVPQRTSIPDGLPVTVRDVVTVGAWGRVGRWRPLDRRARAVGPLGVLGQHGPRQRRRRVLGGGVVGGHALLEQGRHGGVRPVFGQQGRGGPGGGGRGFGGGGGGRGGGGQGFGGGGEAFGDGGGGGYGGRGGGGGGRGGDVRQGRGDEADAAAGRPGLAGGLTQPTTSTTPMYSSSSATPTDRCCTALK